MPTIACKTLGCKVNQYDTEAMLELFEASGYESVDFENEADVYLINTCTVTGTGDSKSLKLIRRINREHPSSHIIVAGCLAQRTPEKLLLPGVCLVIGVQQRANVVELFKKAIADGTPVNATAPLKNAVFEQLTVNRHEGKTRACIKIQEGCNRYCSYCVIPYVRGPIRSMPLDAIRSEAQRLADSGYSEIVVTGIHMASYGLDSGEKLIDAIAAVCAPDSVKRVRLGSLEPVCADDKFASALAKLGKVCPQFHLSLQSGSQTVLMRMNRRYTPEEYLASCESLRKAFPGCAITTDIITGFPGETEEEFTETLEFVKKVSFARVHAFPYSRRSGTVADRLPGQVDESIKKERTARLIVLASGLENAYVASKIGSVQSVLFETECEGYTDSYVRVRAKGVPGEINDVFITGSEESLAIGEVR